MKEVKRRDRTAAITGEDIRRRYNLEKEEEYPMPLSKGGTGAPTAEEARENLGLKGAAVIDTPVSVEFGGTGRDSLTGVLVGNGTNAIEAQSPLSPACGGTGRSCVTANALVTGAETSFGEIPTALGALYSEGTNLAASFGTLPVSCGGTGKTSFPSGSVLTGDANGNISAISILSPACGGTGRSCVTANALVTGAETSFGEIPTALGALYSEGTNLAASFDTLPVSCGGTDATTDVSARVNLGFGKLLWSGSLVPGGSVTVADIGDYNLFAMYFRYVGWVICGAKISVVNGTLNPMYVMPYQNDLYTLVFSFSVSGNTLSMGSAAIGTQHKTTSSHASWSATKELIYLVGVA